MGYSPRYHIYTSEFPGHHSETDDWGCVESEMKRCKDRGDYNGVAIDTHTGKKTHFPPLSDAATATKVEAPR